MTRTTVKAHVEGRIYHVDLDTGTYTVPLGVALSYRSDDPYAVTVSFTQGTDDAHDRVDWIVDRALLCRGLETSTSSTDIVPGHPAPDVRVSTHGLACGDWTVITVESPTGRADIGLPTYELIDFMADTEKVIAPCSESEHLGALHNKIDRLLRQGTGR